jgi:fatty acid desaturase
LNNGDTTDNIESNSNAAKKSISKFEFEMVCLERRNEMKLTKYLGLLFLIVWLLALILAVNFPALTNVGVFVALLISAASVFLWMGWVQLLSEENLVAETGEQRISQDSQPSVYRE